MESDSGSYHPLPLCQHLSTLLLLRSGLRFWPFFILQCYNVILKNVLSVDPCVHMWRSQDNFQEVPYQTHSQTYWHMLYPLSHLTALNSPVPMERVVILLRFLLHMSQFLILTSTLPHLFFPMLFINNYSPSRSSLVYHLRWSCLLPHAPFTVLKSKTGASHMLVSVYY